MIAKEKAKELVDKFYQNQTLLLINEKRIAKAKQCALIAVDLLFEQFALTEYDELYWGEVKEEIEKL